MRRGWRIKMLVISALLFCLIAMVTMGCNCGGSSKGVEEQQEEALQPTQVPTTVTPPATSGGGTSGGQSGPVSGGHTSYSMDGQKIGEGNYSEWLNIVDVRWADHGEYFRVVFQLKRLNGSDTTIVPNVETRYISHDPGPTVPYINTFVYINFNNVRGSGSCFDSDLPEGVHVSMGNSLLEYIELVCTADTEPCSFRVYYRTNKAHPGVSARPSKLHWETNPMRVILDFRMM